MNVFARFTRLLSAALVLTMVLGLSPYSLTLAQTAEVVINEMQVSTDGTDWEFFELSGPAGTDLSGLALVGIESDVGTSAGMIDRVINLDGQTIPGDGYWLGISPAGTSAYGVAGELSILDNSFENSTATYFLVSGFSGAGGQDLDADDDGVLDETPWNAVLDALNIKDSAGDFTYGATSVGPDGSFLPSGTFRCPNGPGGTFEGNILNFSTPDGTPGAENACAPPPPPDVQLVINEIDYDQPSTDAAEFIEIKNGGTSAINLSAATLELVNGTGGGASVYNTIPLPDVTLAVGDYFVVCGNAATVANCDLDVSPDTNLVQNGAPDAVALLFEGAIVDTVSYEGNTGAPYTEGSGVDLEDIAIAGMGISRCPDGSDTDQNNVDFAFAPITPGAENACAPPPPDFGFCGDPETLIHEVQGDGLTSPLAGQNGIILEGVVVGDFQDPDVEFGGFYLQEEDAEADANPLTSEGIFVFDDGFGVDVSVGDLVRVQGNVTEFFGLTELNDVINLAVCESGFTVTPASVLLPVSTVEDFEPFEGMSVVIEQPLYISEYFNFDRFGEIVLTTERQFQPTAIYEPGSPEYEQLLQENLLGRITLDDGRSDQNPDPARHPNGEEFTLDNRFRGGDLVQDVVGVMDYSFGLYRIQPTGGATYIPENLRPEAPEDVGGSLKVATFNVLNYFTTLGSRGADTPEEFERQRDKIFAALEQIDADVVGLMEIENNTEAIEDLVTGLNELVGAGTYAYIDTGVIGTDEIKVALIYKPATVSPLGDYAILDSTVDPRFLDDYNRPVLAQTFQDDTTGGIFTVAVNHLKSKGSDCNAVGDPDLGDGAGNCNLTRLAAAEALVDWLATDPTGSGDADYLIIGDLNSYDKEDPIDAILEGPDDILGTGDDYRDLLHDFVGEFAYTYVFDGQLGYLDYQLANLELLPEVTGATAWHINADEPDILDYDMTFKQDPQDALYEVNPFRSSDHDPVIVGLEVCDEIAPTLEVSVSPEFLWPPNHQYVDVTAVVIAGDNFDPDPTVELVSVTSSEPDDGLGDGDTPNDIVIVDDTHFMLRAERSALGDGRVYTITYQVTDDCGNTTTASATVQVDHDQSDKVKSSAADLIASALANGDTLIFLPSLKR